MKPFFVDLSKTIRPVQFFSFPAYFKPDQAVMEGISTDSRTLKKKDWFIAIKGQTFNGAHFLSDALSKGISGAIVNEESLEVIPVSYKNSAIPIIVVTDTIKAYGALAKAYFNNLTASTEGKRIAITGSAGKTTCKDFLSHLLSTEFKVFFSKNNLNNHIGVPQNIFQIEELFDFYIFEIGMNHNGEIDYLSSLIEPDHTIITNILPAHIGFFDSLEKIALAKAEIYNHQSPLGTAYIPKEESFFPLLKKQATEKKIKKIQAVDTHSLSIKSHFNKAGELFHNIKTNLADLDGLPIQCAGKHYEKNLALAVEIALRLGLSTDSLKKAIPLLKPTTSRFEIICQSPLIIDDAYNANPISMIEAIKWCLNLGVKNVYIVLGDIFELGEKEKFYHQQIGEKIADLAENNNKAKFVFIGKAMKETVKTLKSLPKGKNMGLSYFENQEKAIGYLKETLQTNNLYFFKASNGMRFQYLIQEFLCFTT